MMIYINCNKAGRIGSIVGYSCYIICVMIGTKIFECDSIGILVWCHSYYTQISIVTRIDGRNATNYANLMILVSFERGDSGLSIHGLIVNFNEFDANIQSNRKDIYDLVLIKSVLD